jgi:hypothetical protein
MESSRLYASEYSKKTRYDVLCRLALFEPWHYSGPDTNRTLALFKPWHYSGPDTNRTLALFEPLHYSGS